MENTKWFLGRVVLALRALVFSFSVMVIILALIHTATGLYEGDLVKGHVFGYSISLGSGKSMEPTFHNGFLPTVLLDKKMEVEDLEVGDIIRFRAVFQGEKMQVVHRVIEITEEGRIITKGDGNETDDPVEAVINSDTFIGKVNYVLKGGTFRNVKYSTPAEVKEEIWERKLDQAALRLNK